MDRLLWFSNKKKRINSIYYFDMNNYVILDTDGFDIAFQVLRVQRLENFPSFWQIATDGFTTGALLEFLGIASPRFASVRIYADGKEIFPINLVQLTNYAEYCALKKLSITFCMRETFFLKGTLFVGVLSAKNAVNSMSLYVYSYEAQFDGLDVKIICFFFCTHSISIVHRL